MNKKIVFIIICIILVLAVVGVWNFSGNKEETENTNNVSNENIIENVDENQEENTETSNETMETTETIESDSSEKTILNQVSPFGFMGSSSYRVVLYSDGEVYVQRFDGNGTEDDSIVSNDLIAQNVTSIEAVDDEEDERYGEVIVKGGDVLDTDFGWIEFE